MKKQEGLKFPEIKKAAQILKRGGIAIFPTDTVYGIGCRFDDRQAIERLYRIKKTPQTQHFPILVSDVNQVKKLANINEVAGDLIHKYWPGGLTIVLPGLSTHSKPGLEQLGKPGLKGLKIGFRMPNSDLVLSMIEEVGTPIIGTSANFHGRVTPKSFEDLDPQFIKLVDFVISGECQGGVESTVVDVTTDLPNILRKGVVKL